MSNENQTQTFPTASSPTSDRPIRPIERSIQISRNCAVEAEQINDRLNHLLNRLYQIEAPAIVGGAADTAAKPEEVLPELHQLQNNLDRMEHQLNALTQVTAALEQL